MPFNYVRIGNQVVFVLIHGIDRMEDLIIPERSFFLLMGESSKLPKS